MASPFSWMLIFFNDRSGGTAIRREMYCERAFRAWSECDPIRTEQSKEKPECFQLIRLVARLALMSFFFIGRVLSGFPWSGQVGERFDPV